jgi:hypothetical protein
MEPKAMLQNPLPVNPTLNLAISSNNVEPTALATDWVILRVMKMYLL